MSYIRLNSPKQERNYTMYNVNQTKSIYKLWLKTATTFHTLISVLYNLKYIIIVQRFLYKSKWVHKHKCPFNNMWFYNPLFFTTHSASTPPHQYFKYYKCHQHQMCSHLKPMTLQHVQKSKSACVPYIWTVCFQPFNLQSSFFQHSIVLLQIPSTCSPAHQKGKSNQK